MSLKLLTLAWIVCFGIGAHSARVKRQSRSGIITNSGAEILGLVGSLIPDEREAEGFGCAYRHGCHKGRCWAGCDATVAYNEWCYTTRGYSQDFKYVSCSRDSDCNACWKCAGSCTV